MKKPDTEAQILHYSHQQSKIVKFMEAGSQDGGHLWLGGEVNRVMLIKGYKFLFCKLSKSWRSIYYSICSLKCCIVYLKICQDVSPYVNFLNTKNT